MIGDIIISLARGRKDKVNGTGRWHFMKNRYGADGLTFGSKIDTSNGKIDIYETPLDDDEEGDIKPVNAYSNVKTIETIFNKSFLNSIEANSIYYIYNYNNKNL